MSRYMDYSVASAPLVAADLGATFAEIRLSRNLTQVALASQAGVSVGTVKRLESGQGATLDSLIRLMQALGLSNQLEVLLPRPEIQPALAAAHGVRRRQRARSKEPVERAPWTWDKDLTP